MLGNVFSNRGRNLLIWLAPRERETEREREREREILLLALWASPPSPLGRAGYRAGRERDGGRSGGGREEGGEVREVRRRVRRTKRRKDLPWLSCHHNAHRTAVTVTSVTDRVPRCGVDVAQAGQVPKSRQTPIQSKWFYAMIEICEVVILCCLSGHVLGQSTHPTSNNMPQPPKPGGGIWSFGPVSPGVGRWASTQGCVGRNSREMEESRDWLKVVQ